MCIFLTQKLNNIVSKIETRKPYYENIEEWLHKMTELMLQNEQETILFFTNARNLRHVLYTGSAHVLMI
jgi:hypothetical protein